MFKKIFYAKLRVRVEGACFHVQQ